MQVQSAASKFYSPVGLRSDAVVVTDAESVAEVGAGSIASAGFGTKEITRSVAPFGTKEVVGSTAEVGAGSVVEVCAESVAGFSTMEIVGFSGAY